MTTLRPWRATVAGAPATAAGAARPPRGLSGKGSGAAGVGGAGGGGRGAGRMGRIGVAHELVLIRRALAPLVDDRRAVVLLASEQVVAVAVAEVLEALGLDRHAGRGDELVVGALVDRIGHPLEVVEQRRGVLGA